MLGGSGRRIGLFPGTFDPVHLGHVAMARAALVAGDLDEVWLLVDSAPRSKVNALSYSHRIAMLQLAVTDHERLRIGDAGDTRLPHTLAGFRELMKGYPEHDFTFIVGSDTLARLGSWESPAAVLASARFLVADRAADAGGRLDGLRQYWGRLGHELRAELFEFDDHSEASSTVVRGQLKVGVRPETLDGRVYEYARQHNLYH